MDQPARELNESLGVAQPTMAMLDNAEKHRLETSEEVRPPPHGVWGEFRARGWASRSRRRCGGRYKSVPPRDPMGHAELRAKATSILSVFLLHHLRFSCGIALKFALRIASPGAPRGNTRIEVSLVECARGAPGALFCASPGAPFCASRKCCVSQCKSSLKIV